MYFFDDENKTKEDIKHLKVFYDDRFYYLPTKSILVKLFKKKYDVIIKCTNNKWSFIGCFLLAKLIKAKFIVWHTIWYYPETLQYKLFSWFLIKVLKEYSDAIVVYGEHGKRFLINKGVDPNKIFIAWQTVDNETFGREVKDDEITLIKQKFNITKDKKIVLYVGRLTELKGIEYLLEALNKLNKDDFSFVAIGHGNLKNRVEKYCKDNEIDYRLIGIIPNSDLPPYYKLATVFVLPSITTKTFKEPWGLVVNEAFNQGCPVVVTDAVGAGVGGLVKNEKNGFVVPEKDSRALNEAIGRILDADGLHKRLSESADEEIKKWTYERQAHGFLDAIEYSLGNRQP
jgi:Glycosyltransferase